MGARQPPGLLEDVTACLAADPAHVALGTAFQPIYSLSHSRLVGHEALLRPRHRFTGLPMAPNDFFAALQTPTSLAKNDADCVRQHLAAYRCEQPNAVNEWLFINVHPASLIHPEHGLESILSSIQSSPLENESLVIEILESALAGQCLTPLVQQIRAQGCLIAVDDFGAGHSNFDRVFDLAPDIVKLDRQVLLRAERSPKARRIVERMVSLLHECGALVLMEGIETLEGAHIALACDVDLVQGYFFARPQAARRNAADACAPLEEGWATFNFAASKTEDNWRAAMAWQCDKLRMAAELFANGQTLAQACGEFLKSGQASMCYLLDEHGRQVGNVVHSEGRTAATLAAKRQFAPLHNTSGARWSRRPYFRRATASVGAVQLTRPYLTMQGEAMCLTASIAFEDAGRLLILCGDISVTQVPA